METTRKLSRREKLSLIGKYLRPCWGHFAAALLCACLAMVFNALTPQIIRITVDSILGPETPQLPGFLMSWLNWAALEAQPLRALWWAAAAVLLTALLRGVCSYGQRLQLARGSESYVKGIRDDLYRHIQYLPFAWHKNNPTGDIIQRCTSDVDVIRQFVCNQLVEVVRTVFLIVLYLCIMFTMNLRLSLISALFIPIVGLSSGVFYKKISGRFQAADEAEGDLTTCAQENLTAVRVVRAFGRERYEEEKFNGKNQRFSQLWIRLGKLLSVYWASGTLLTCLQVMVIVVAGACECVAGRMTLGSFVAFVTYNEALAWPVRSLGRVLSDMSKAGVSMDRVGYILNAREERDLPDAVDAVNGDIVFDHVSFAYDGQPVLEDVSFTIHQGETFAILGGTGSGKSTLVHLLDRLYDLPEGGGSITIGGVDIRRMKRESLRRQIGLVLQEPFLFSQTVGENICAVRPDAGDEAMRRAAAVGKPIVAHCEVDDLLRGGYIHDGVYCREHGHKGICSESEWRQVERDIALAEKTGCQYHVCHVSTKESVDLVRQARAKGLKVSCETAPHYLLLCDEDLREEGRFKMNPPLRSRADRRALLEGIADGTIEVIATDHAPHTAAEKARGLAGSAMGIVGLETAFPLLYKYLVLEGVITLETVSYTHLTLPTILRV